MKHVSRIRWIALLWIVAVALAACGGGGSAAPKPPTPQGDATKGAQVFAGTCSACHGPDGKGMPNLGKDLTTSTWLLTQSDEQFFKFLHVGRPASDKLNTVGVDMPPKGGNPALTDQDLTNVVAYVRSIHVK